LGKYSKLGAFLQNSKNDTEVLSFRQIESIIGSVLPNSALVHREWWANELNPNTRHTQCREWVDIGWKVDSVILGDKVSFLKG
jgi:hypothetical protein